MYQQFCGIDVSKDSFDITLLESNGEVKLQEKLLMDREGFNALLKYLSSYSKETCCNRSNRYLSFSFVIFFT